MIKEKSDLQTKYNAIEAEYKEIKTAIPELEKQVESYKAASNRSRILDAVKKAKKTAVKRSLEKEVRSKEVEEGKKQVRVKNETSDSCLLSSKSAPTIYRFGVK